MEADMTSGAPPAPQADPEAPEAAFRGRFAVYPQEPKGAVIAYATELCDRCLTCGCGAPQEPLDMTPAGMMKMMAGGKLGKLKGMIRL